MQDYIDELKDDLENEKENVRNYKEEKKQLLIDIDNLKKANAGAMSFDEEDMQEKYNKLKE